MRAKNDLVLHENFASLSAPSSAPSSTKAVVFIDDAPLRSATSWQFKKIYDNYLRVKAEIEHHESRVRPTYQRWLARMFRDRFSELERLHAELLRRSALLQRMVQLFVFEDRSKARAFEEAQAELDREEPGDNGDNEDADFWSRDEDEDEDATSGARHDESEASDADGSAGEPTGQRRKTAPNAGGDSAAAARAAREMKIKSLYRKLAQALHPDLAGEPSELARELWLETQAAYERRDVGHLDLLWTMLSLERNPHAREVSLGDLRRALESMKEKLNEARREKRLLAKNDPAWGFEKKSQAQVEREIRRDLDREETMLSDALGEIEAELTEFSRSAERNHARSKRRRGRSRSFDF